MITLNELVDLRMQQHLAHEIYRQQIMQRIPDPFTSIMPIPMPRPVMLSSPSTLSGVEVKLQNNDLWSQFHQIGTEMIITKNGRRMFPSLRLSVSGIEDELNYCVLLEMSPIRDCRFKYSGSHWVPAGGIEPQSPHRLYVHPDSPASGAHWKAQPILFNKIKLTNNTMDSHGHIILASMHKYQPRIHIVQTSDASQFAWAPQQDFEFPETEFIAVTAYQNDRITKLKIDNNPFAKGFRETGQSRCKRKMNAMTQQATDRPVSNPSLDCERSRSDDNDGPMAKRMRSNSSATSISSSDEGGHSFSCSSSGASSPNVALDQLNYYQSITPSALPTVASSSSSSSSSLSPSALVPNENLMPSLHQNFQNFINPAFVDLAYSYFGRPPYAANFFPTAAALGLQNSSFHHTNSGMPSCFPPSKLPSPTKSNHRQLPMPPYPIPLVASSSSCTPSSTPSLLSSPPARTAKDDESIPATQKTKTTGFSISAILGAEK